MQSQDAWEKLLARLGITQRFHESKDIEQVMRSAAQDCVRRNLSVGLPLQKSNLLLVGCDLFWKFHMLLCMTELCHLLIRQDSHRQMKQNIK